MKKLKALVDNDKPRSKDYKAWQRELRAWEWIGCLHLENVMEVIAIVSKSKDKYFMFPWANGGNLTEFCMTHQNPSLSVDFIRDIVKQLTGLAQALCRLHEYNYEGNEGSYRHGDLKPENIVIHNNIWKITDLGQAKFHADVTGKRERTTTKLGGTVSYEPPEAFLARNAPTTRLYDVWSMGCIIFQLTIWLLCGYEALEELHDKLSDYGSRDRILWKRMGDNGPAVLHPEVIKTMSHISEKSQNMSPAVGRLVDLVRTRLLVVQLPSNASNSDTPCRATAKELHLELCKILDENNEAYWCSPAGQRLVRGSANVARGLEAHNATDVTEQLDVSQPFYCIFISYISH